jgi:hypothetical protein
MTTALITTDLLLDSIRHSFVAANEMILRSSRNTPDRGNSSAERGTAPHQEARFVVGNASGKPPVSIPLALFQSSACTYLSSLHLDLPCYTISGVRLFKERQRTSAGVLHAYAPTLWQRLTYRCYLYHLMIDIEVDQARVIFRSASDIEAAVWGEKMKRTRTHTAWAFRLSSDQEQQLAALPQIPIEPVYWSASLKRGWRWLTSFV